MDPEANQPSWQATRLLRETKRRRRVADLVRQDWSPHGWRSWISGLAPIPLAFAVVILYSNEGIFSKLWIIAGTIVCLFGATGYWVAWSAMARIDALVDVLRSEGAIDRFSHDIDVWKVPPPGLGE